ncbi:MAG: hypothetical protein DRN27_04935 [Thermoplasmata archaeon]|nr:MAG: hypothetical protein DRN27_04935 [Thermoplasmata archaeon]
MPERGASIKMNKGTVISIFLMLILVIWIPTISSDKSKDENLVASWHFNEGTGSITYDSSGNGNDGIINGASWSNGVNNTALEFDGSDDYVQVPDSASLDMSDEITISTWVNFDSINPSQPPIIVMKRDDSGSGEVYKLGIADGDGSEFEIRFVGDYLLAGGNIEIGNWYHLVGTYDGVHFRLYQDGLQVAESVYNGFISISDNDVYVGVDLDNWGFNQYLDGTIDEVRLYNRALTADEILTLYQQYTPSEPTTAYVDNNYTPSTPGWQYDHFNVIQDGIDAVSENGTVFVYNGTYYENVVVNKTIDLIGENRISTVIDGGGNGDVVHISDNYVNISGFTVKNSGNIRSPDFDAGIDIHSDYNIISDNHVSNDDFGIFIGNSTNNIVSGNIASNNNNGIYLHSSNNNTVSYNNAHYNNFSGINLWTNSNNNHISSNNISNNSVGISLYESCCNNNIAGNNASNNEYGIDIEDSSNNNIILENNVCSNDNVGIYIIINCSNNLIDGNIVKYNEEGIRVWYESSANIIVNNSIINNYQEGLFIHFCPWDNLVYHNNLINNNPNAFHGFADWDNGYPSGGNYWSDYTGTDADGDGIGDTPYIMSIPGGNVNDSYPFIEENGWLKSIDVDQNVWGRGFPIRHAIDGDWAGAQSFQTSNDSLTRVDVYLRKFGTPEFNLTLEIHEGAVDGTLIESFEFLSGDIDVNWRWLNLDLEDIETSPGTNYFIVCPPAPSGVTTSFGYEWGYAFGNQYDDGVFWFTRDGGGLWRDLPTMYEFVFRTYGYN